MVQNVRRKRGLYLLVNYFCQRRQEPFPGLPGVPRIQNPPGNLHEAVDPIPRVAAGEKGKQSLTHTWFQWEITVFQQSDSLLSLPLSPCWLRKGRPEISRLCKKKVRLAGTIGIELTVYWEQSFPSSGTSLWKRINSAHFEFFPSDSFIWKL